MTVRDRLEKLRQHQNARKSCDATPDPSAARESRPTVAQQKQQQQQQQPPNKVQLESSIPSHQAAALSPAALVAHASICRKPTPHIPVYLPSEVQTDYWSIMAKQAAVESEQLRGGERASHLQCVRNTRTTLDEQIALKQRQKEAEKARAVELRLEQKRLKEQWDLEERQKDEAKRIAGDRVKVEREEQVKQLDARKEKQRQQQIREDEEMQIQAEKQLAEVRRLAELDKERRQLVMLSLVEANKTQRAEIEGRKQKEREMDRYYDEQATLKAEKDEQARAAAMQKLLDKMSASDSIAAVNLAGEQEKIVAEEERIKQYEARRLDREAKVKAAEDAKHHLVLQKVKEVQAIQRNTKLVLLEEQAQQKQKDCDTITKLIAEEKQATLDAKLQARSKRLQQRSVLQEQLRDNASYQHVVVSDIERTMNKNNIEKAVFLQQNGALSAEQLRHASPF